MQAIINEIFVNRLRPIDYWSWDSSDGITVGRVRAQAVSRWLPTAATRVRVRVWQVGFVVNKVALGQVSSEYFGFSCQYLFHQILHHHNHPGQVK
jgi:hypothetical protein